MATDTTAGSDPEKKVVTTKHIAVDPNEFPHLLKQFYERLFPYNRFYRWLSYGSQRDFENREFSFTLKDDIYIRYRSYSSETEMTEDIKKMNPYKIDIGAVFTGKPKDHKKIKASEFKPVARELVFDIDMTDYDEIRTCCSGAAICESCWPFMRVAARIVDKALREDFGFEQILWVYSGRRGIHAWVCDKRARALSNEARAAVAEWLSVVVGGENAARKVDLKRPVFPAIQRALGVSKVYFEKWILKSRSAGGQDVLKGKESREKLIAAIGDATIEKTLTESWDEAEKSNSVDEVSVSKDRWAELCETVEDATKKSGKRANWHPLHLRPQEIMLQYTYPRLDVHVSTQMNHLLKSPFVVHPKTGRVCVPFDVDQVDNFNPFTVPNINTLMKELDDYADAHPNSDSSNRPVHNFEKTSLKPAIEVFDRFLEGCQLENESAMQLVRETNEKNAAATGDW